MIVNTDNKNYKNMISLYQINEVINISFNEHYNIDGVYIYDLEGKLIKALKSNIKSNNTFWNGDDEYNNPVSNGCYIIHIDLGDKTLAKRFVF